MVDHIIRVFSEEDKSRFLNAGFLLLKADKKNSIYEFAYNKSIRFENFDPTSVQFVANNILTF